MRSHYKGFTLIELLVVISIISLLSSIAIGSLRTSREKAMDQLVIENLRTVRTQAEVYHSVAGKYKRSGTSAYSGGCNINYTMFYETSLTANDPKKISATIIKQALDNADLVSGATSKHCRMDAAGTQYLVAIRLKTSNNYWCIDYTGRSKKITTSLPATGVYICP